MTFDVLSSATTVGHQKAHLSLLNSNISKLIHDQGKVFSLITRIYYISGDSSFCWAFSISTMLRQSLKNFLQTLPSSFITHAALQKIEENEFHKRLSNELIMLPIPKAKFFSRKVPTGVNSVDFEDEIIGKQAHVLNCAIDRVSRNQFFLSGNLKISF